MQQVQDAALIGMIITERFVVSADAERKKNDKAIASNTTSTEQRCNYLISFQKLNG